MKKKLVLILSIIILILGVGIGVYIFINNNEEQKELEEQKLLLKEIKSHYNEYVITNKETKLYKKENDEFIEYGKINKDVSLILDSTEIKLNTKYFYIKDLELYIKYEDVDPTKEYTISDRYKNYIYFNNNIRTKDSTNFYDIDGNYLYTINESYDFKILVKEDDKYGIVFKDELLFIPKEDVEKVYDSNNTDLKNKSKIRTLTYHFIYNPETTTCTESICQSLEQFESHLKYIKENNYFTLKLNELELYLDGKIQIPENSIVLTIDDGTIFDLEAIKLLEKYEANATLFVITKINDDFSYLNSEYLDLESHTENMHNQYECRGYGSQGGGILCLPEEQVLSDLKTSQEKLGGSKYFAYPFFDFNDRAISLLKQAGFKLAFIGQYDTEGYSYPNVTDKYKVRRMTIFSNTTMDEFVEYLN